MKLNIFKKEKADSLKTLSLFMAVGVSILPFFTGLMISVAENWFQCDILLPCSGMGDIVLGGLGLLLYGSILLFPVGILFLLGNLIIFLINLAKKK